MSETTQSRGTEARIAEGRNGQLRLLPGGTPEPDWMLDERTRSVGRQGIARAREVLRRAQPPEGVLGDKKAS